MDKEASLKLSSYISQKIINDSPVVNYTSSQLEKEKKKYPQKQLDELRDEGYYKGDFETFYVVKKLCDLLNKQIARFFCF